MPANQHLCCAIRADSRRFAFANHRVARKIESLFSGQRAGRLNVITLHRNFAEIVQQGGGVQRPAIVSCKMKLERDFVSDDRDALRVRVFVTFELVDSLRELYERVRGGFIDQLSCVHGDHGCPILAIGCGFTRTTIDYVNDCNSSRALRLFGSAATARSASPFARSFRPRSLYSSASITRYSALFGSSFIAAV